MADRDRVGAGRRDQAETRSTEGGAEIAISRQIDRHAERGRDRLQPVARARTAADRRHARKRRAGGTQRFEIVADGEGDAFEHRLGQHHAAALVAEAGEGAADRGIIVRRALAGEIGQEGHAAWRLQRLAEFGGEVGGALAGDRRNTS